MKKENIKMFKKFFVLLGFFIALISAITTNVEAREYGEGVGGPPTVSEWGHWLSNEDTSSNPKAFDRFLNTQVRVRGDYSKDGLKRRVNSMGSGAKLPNGNRETLVATCNRSQYVWWYGEAIGGPSYPKEYWYTLGRNTHKIPTKHWQTMSPNAKDSLKTYKAQSSNWTSGSVVLICSALHTPPPPVEVPITVRAKSGTFTYDGKNKTVSGYSITNGNLKSGHRISVSSSRTARNVGSYNVPVSSVTMTDSNGKNVTSEYKITTREGTLRINPKSTPEGDDYRCITPRTDTATATVQSVTTGSHGYTPNGVGNLRTIEAVSTKASNGYKSSVPSVNSSISTWNTWKRNFQGGSNSSTPEIDLESGGVSGMLSTHGGVYNVLKTLRRDTYTVEHCQPQTRELEDKTRTEYSNEVTKNPDGSTTTTRVPHTVRYQEWSAWANSGERKLTKVSGPVRTNEYRNYQILSVNCNLDGFNSVKNSTGGDVIAIGNGDGSAALKTPAKLGRTTGNLGKSGATSTSSFYTDGESCDVFTCTVTPNASVLNDAKNNNGNTNLFGEVLEDGTVGETNEAGELVFFRDNEDRQVRADLWYPKATGLADLDANFGSPAKDTFVKVYDDSTSGHVNPTPEIELTTIVPWNKPESYKIGLVDIGGVKRYDDEINRFNIKSQWASEDGAPYQLGVNWEYKATGKNRIPTKVNGESIISNKDYDKDFDIHCEFRNETNEYKANIPDRPYAEGGLNASDTTWTPSNAIRTLFSRSASAMD